MRKCRRRAIGRFERNMEVMKIHFQRIDRRKASRMDE
jgi:hypothetical protein